MAGPNVVDTALAGLFGAGLEPTYWRRTRTGKDGKPKDGVPWHRGFVLPGQNAVVGACGRMAKRDGHRVLYVKIEEGVEWPDPHCPTCETGRPGSDAVYEAVHGHKRPKTGQRAGFRPRGDPSRWRGGSG